MAIQRESKVFLNGKMSWPWQMGNNKNQTNANKMAAQFQIWPPVPLPMGLRTWWVIIHDVNIKKHENATPLKRNAWFLVPGGFTNLTQAPQRHLAMASRRRQAMGTPSNWERPVTGNAITLIGSAITLNGNAGVGWGGLGWGPPWDLWSAMCFFFWAPVCMVLWSICLVFKCHRTVSEC